MPEPAARRSFTILDAVILTAGFAIGFALLPGFRFELPFDVIYWYARVGIGILTVGCGLILVGPLVIWRGRRLTGRGPRSFGEWLWLLSWPIALPFVVVGPGPVRAAFMTWLSIGLIGALIVAGGFAAARTRWRVGVQTSPALRPSTPGIAVGLLWGSAFVGWLSEDLPLAAAVFWLQIANVLLWSAAIGVSSRLTRASRPPRPWSHWVGLAAAAALPLGLLVFAIGY